MMVSSLSQQHWGVQFLFNQNGRRNASLFLLLWGWWVLGNWYGKYGKWRRQLHRISNFEIFSCGSSCPFTHSYLYSPFRSTGPTKKKKRETKCIDISNILVGIDKFPVSQNTRRRDCQWIVMKQCMSQHCTLLWSRKGGGSFLAASMDEEEVAGLGDLCWTQLTLHNSTK